MSLELIRNCRILNVETQTYWISAKMPISQSFPQMSMKGKAKTLPLGTELCPCCGQVGQEKIRFRGKSIYEYYDHYGKRTYTKIHYTYRSSCYAGVL